MNASSSAEAANDLPVQTHSSLFWSDPTDARDAAPRLAVLLLNASHASWHIRREVGPHTESKIKSSELFWTLWSSAQLTMCADGGANRLYDRSVQVEAENIVVPQYIKGDLDSLRDDVRAFYEAHGTKVLHDPDQYSNDLDKCLQLIDELQRPQQDQLGKFTVIIFGAMGGRFDQEMQNINALFRWGERFEQMVLLSEDTTARLLLPGYQHIIRPNFDFESRTCGLIPVAGTCSETTTTGLKWNLDGDAMGFGQLISSSNHVDDAGEEVRVRCSHPLVWTTELKRS